METRQLQAVGMITETATGCLASSSSASQIDGYMKVSPPMSVMCSA